MSLEWYTRMENSVRQCLPDVCDGLEDFDILFDTDTTTRHPVFIFSLDFEDMEDEFCLIHFDPQNQEFYSYHYDETEDLDSKVLFHNLEDMLQFIHAAFHEYLEDLDEEYEHELADEEGYYEDDDEDVYSDDDDEYYEDSDEEADDSDIEWITNDKYLHIEEHYDEQDLQFAIHYKLGTLPETGDGVLLRNTIVTQDGDEATEQVMMFFKQEEAEQIVDLMNQYIAYSNKTIEHH
ncbi:hypothetical protein [Bacillus sp. 165]|uniref:hypothetical protein n=1 Tax=Bacillus sp. 165 TaxID=1529117 RepID=UPI001ADA6F46|nr:hypothetical protein [Bacillus sp. 165]MBO9129137.1 hypothetical protein [Bacillus sp. 165]